MKKIIGLLLVLSLLLVPAAVIPATAQTEVLTLKHASSAALGSMITVTVNSPQAYTNVGALRMTLVYDTAYLKYIDGSRDLLTSGIKDADLTPDKAADGKVHFVWSSDTGVNISGNIVSWQFMVDANAPSGTAGLQLQIYDMYLLDSNYTGIVMAPNTVRVSSQISIAPADSSVAAVVSSINAIGTVTTDTACKTKIDAALSAYNKLTVLQQKQVGNYSVLVAAVKQYNDLLKLNETNAHNAAINKFRTDYAYALGLTAETITLKDKDAVNKATAAWNALPNNALKSDLIVEKNLLRSLSTRLVELQKIYDKELSEQELKKGAEDIAKQFRLDYAHQLALTETTVATTDRMGVNAGISEIDGYAFVNSYAPELLAKEKAYLTKLLARIDQMILDVNKEEAPHITEANKFTERFGWLLSVNEEDLSSDDYTDIAIANAFWEYISDDAKELLPGTGEKLEALLAKAEELAAIDGTIIDEPDDPSQDEPDEDQPADTDDESAKDETPKAEIKSVISYVRQNTHPLVLWSGLYFLISVTAFAGAAFAYFVRRRLGKQQS